MPKKIEKANWNLLETVKMLWMNMNLKDAKNIKNVQIIRKTMNVTRLLAKKN